MVDDKMHGFGIKITDGKIQEGEWKDGNFVRSVPMKKQEEVTATLLKTQEEDPALLQKKQQNERFRLVEENLEDIDDIRSLLSRIGFSKSESRKYAEALVLDYNVNSEMKFQLEMGAGSQRLYSQLHLSSQSVQLVDRYLANTLPSTPITPTKITTTASPPPHPVASPLTSPSQTLKHWNCFMVLIFITCRVSYTHLLTINNLLHRLIIGEKAVRIILK